MDRMPIERDEHFIVARDLGVNTVRIKSFSHVDLDLASGRAHAVCAEHHGGKTELLLTLAGRMHRTEGTLTVAGIDATALSRLKRVRAIAGLAFFERVNEVEQNLRTSTVVSAELSLAGKPAGRAEANAFLGAWGLGELADKTVSELAAYDYDLLGIALGMAGDPALLVVDDIETDLTEHQSRKLAELLCDLAHDTGTTVVCGVTDYDLASCFDDAVCITEDARAQRAAFEEKHALKEAV